MIGNITSRRYVFNFICIIGNTILTRAYCVNISTMMCTTKTSSGAMPNTFNKKYAMGTIIKSIVPSIIWNFLSFPVAWTETIIGLDNVYSNPTTRISLKKLTVCSGTMPNHNFNTVCASNIKGTAIIYNI